MQVKSAQKSMQRFVHMWQHKSLVTTYNAWKRFTLQQVHDKTIMKKFVIRMVHAKLMAPFHSWVEHAETMRRNEQLMQKWGRRWRNRTVVRTLEGWKEFVKVSKEENNEQLQWERKVSSVLKKMMNGKLLGLFNTWRDSALEQKQNRAIVSKFVKRMQMSGAVRALAQWRGMVGVRKWLRRIMGRMLGGREAKLLLAGWTTWRMKVKEMSDEGMLRIIQMLEAAVEESRERTETQANQIEELEEHIRVMFGDKQEKAVQVLVKMMHANLSCAFNTWLERCSELKRHENIIIKFGNRIRLSSAGKAMATMKEYYLQRKFLKKFLNRMIGGRRVRMLAAGLASWKAHVFLHIHGEKEAELDALEAEIEELRKELDENAETIEMYAQRYARERSERMSRQLGGKRALP